MDLAAEMRLARLIMDDAQQLRGRVAVEGVTAYLRQPVHRAPPNDRFLKNMLQSVEFANQQSDVNEMWRMREMQLERERRMQGETRRIRPRDGCRSGGNTESSGRTPSQGGSTPKQRIEKEEDDANRPKKRRRNPGEGGKVESSRRHKQDCDEVGHGDEGFRMGSGCADAERIDCSSGDEEDYLKSFLTSRHVRGRGGVGSRHQDDTHVDDFPGSVAGAVQKQAYTFVFSDDSIPHTSHASSGEKKRKKHKKKKDSKRSKKDPEKGGGSGEEKKRRREKTRRRQKG